MGNNCSACATKDRTIQQLVGQIDAARADIGKAQRAASEAAYALQLLTAEATALKGGVHVYLDEIGRHGVSNCLEVAFGALASAVKHQPITMASSAAALAALWHVCFRAHINRLKRQTAFGQPLGELLETGRLADVNVCSRDGPPIAAHACILSTSPYFAALLQLQELAAGRRPHADARLELRCDETHADMLRYVEWLYLGSVGELNAEALFVLADRLTDSRLQLACSQQTVAVRTDTKAWWQLVTVAGAAAVGVLMLCGRLRS
jgi:hypothetical protein